MNETNERFDPIEALFSGLGSGLGRAAIGVAAIFAGYGINSWANTAPGRSFAALDSLFMIFTWADYGLFFVLGLASLVVGFFVYYRFMVDEGGKLEWFILFTLFALYYSPMNFTREDWPQLKGKPTMMDFLLADIGDPVVKHDWVRLLTAFTSAAAVYWLLPVVISLIVKRTNATTEE